MARKGRRYPPEFRHEISPALARDEPSASANRKWVNLWLISSARSCAKRGARSSAC